MLRRHGALLALILSVVPRQTERRARGDGGGTRMASGVEREVSESLSAGVG